MQSRTISDCSGLSQRHRPNLVTVITSQPNEKRLSHRWCRRSASVGLATAPRRWRATAAD